MDTSTPLSASRRRVLETLLAEGPVTARELAGRLGVSPVAIRQHLTGLAADGLAAPESLAAGVGRPASRWRATAQAQGSLADQHQALSTEILRALADAGLVETVLERRTRDQLARYRDLAADADTPEALVQALARIRSDEGYMARAWTDEEGGLFLSENHCPLHCAVQSCLGLCTAELDLFRRFVGPSTRVERTEHIGSGDPRCVYTFTPA